MSPTTACATAIAILLVAGCASTNPDQQSAANANRQCFFTSSASGFAAVDPRTVNVRVGADIYRLDLMNSCRNVTMNQRMSLVSRTGSSVCAGPSMGTTLVIRGVNGQQRCQVRNVTLLSPAEVEALRPRDRP